MRPLLIALDADDVLLDHVPAWMDALEQRTGHRLPVEQIRDWWISNYLPAELHEELMQARTPALYCGMRPVPGAVEGYRRLLARGHRIVIVTADKSCFVPAKSAALARWFLARRIVVADKKRDTVKADLFIDDGLHNQPDILFTQPWNEDAELPAGMVRTKGWDELLKAVDQFAERRVVYYHAA